jgi:S1 RNA binding domain protein
MQLELGKIYEGKVTGIKEYGAFVEIVGENVTGMVHISQISNQYVTNARDHLTEGQTVNVKYIGTNEDGKVKLSIKEALPPEQRKGNPQQKRNHRNGGNHGGGNPQKRSSGGGNGGGYNASSDSLFQKKSESENFEDMLSKFKQHSDENLNDLKRITDRRNRTRRK